MKQPTKNSTLQLKAFLDHKVSLYNTTAFIDMDPISIPHQFNRKEDIEISGFLIATISWGKRPQIIKSGLKLMALLGNAPFDFVMSANQKQINKLDSFVYRTFQPIDIKYFIKGLRNIYKNHGGIESVFNKYATSDSLQPAIHHFRKHFFEPTHPEHAQKHIADPYAGSAAKKMNMYLRWLVRQDDRGVDFGLWKHIKPAQLSCPLDVHSAKVARHLGLLTRRQNDAKALLELDTNLRLLDATDPVKYDFALFGIGVFEGI
ncbi:MAG: TIGR02757 family protein [Phycisphaerales bacterium]|nr:TIGR02757 family protein [Phycisphaerales bacterium]